MRRSVLRMACLPAFRQLLFRLVTESAALAPLPLSVLALSEEQAEKFTLWGIRTLGMLAALA